MPPNLNAILSIQMEMALELNYSSYFNKTLHLQLIQFYCFFFSFRFFLSFFLFFFNIFINISGELFFHVQERTLICFRALFLFVFKYPYEINNSIFEILEGFCVKKSRGWTALKKNAGSGTHVRTNVYCSKCIPGLDCKFL